MALNIAWTKRAIQGYDRIVNNLEERWTEKEVQKFIQESRDFFELLKEYPEILESTGKNKYLRRGPINKLTILTYRIKPRKKVIELINIRPARKKPLL